MNEQAYQAGKDAYNRGDLAGAVTLLGSAKEPGEVSGAIDHLLGNALMRLGRYDEAARCYGDALQDGAYGHAGALATNRGRALLAAGKTQEAIAALSLAVRDEDYATPYKAYSALGEAYERLGDVRNAGAAYRNAAIDETNPHPSVSLRKLGSCFIKMGRAVDAVEAYRTALDFSTSLDNQNPIYADLGLAYVAANRMSEAVDAFGRATADGSYTLSPESQAAYDAARKAVEAITGGGPSETDALLAAAGYGTGAIDPLDPTGSTGEFMPSPEDTGFFSVNEEDLVAQAKKERKVKRKKKGHRGLKAFLVLLIILILLAGAAGYAYYLGYGWPTQESVVEDLISAPSTGEDISDYLAEGTSSETQAQIAAVLPTSPSDVTIDGVTRSMTETEVLATASLSAGGEQSYEVTLVRDGIGWKVSSLTAVYASQDGEAPAVSTDTTQTDTSLSTGAAEDAGTSASGDADGTVTGTISTDE